VDKYIIGVEQQRLLNKKAAVKLLESFDRVAGHHTSELVRVRPVEDPLNFYVPDGQTRLLALTMDPNKQSKTFRVVTYTAVTAEQMVALFEFHSFRRNTSAQDKIALYRYLSPVYQLTQNEPSHVLKPVFNKVKGGKGPLRLTWTEILAGWLLGSRGNGVPSAKERLKTGQPCSASGYNIGLVVKLFKSEESITAFREVERLVAAVQMAAHLSHDVLNGTGGRLSDVGKILAVRMQKFDAEREDAVWVQVMNNPQRRVLQSFWSMSMIRILISLVRANTEDAVYRRLPFLMRVLGRLESSISPTNHTAPYLRDKIEEAINHNARDNKLNFPS